MLEALERGNLFLVPLDDRRQWYRYHHLFADVLHAHLLDEQPDRRRRTCTGGRATGTSENGEPVRGDPPRAGRRGLRAGGGPGRAGDPGHAPDPAGGRAAWLARGAARRGRPGPAACSASASPGRCWPAASSRASRPGCGTPSGGWTHDRRPRVGPQLTPAEMVVVDDEEFRRLPAMIELYRAALALARGDVAEHRRPRPAGARPGAGGRPPQPRVGGGPAGSRVLGERGPRGGAPGVRRMRGRAAAGRPHRRRPRVRDRAGGHPERAGPARRRDAHLRAGVASWPRSRAAPLLRGTADMYVGMSEIHRERGDLPAATQAPAAGARSSASTPGCRRTAIAGGSRWRGSGRPREIWPARSSCSTRQSGCTRATSSPTCDRSRP